MKIAIAGEGGAGKILLAALLTKIFAARKQKVFATDADLPMPTSAVSVSINTLVINNNFRHRMFLPAVPNLPHILQLFSR